MECNYNYKIENFSGRDVLVLEDNDTGVASLEDNLEKIVPQIIKNNDLSDNIMVVYRDRQCIWDGYEFKTDNFVSLNRQSWKSAVDKYIKIQLAKTVDILDLVSQVRQKVYGNEYCTREYDCSYCDENSAYWEVYDNKGHSWKISQEKFYQLQKKWNATAEFVNLHRSINTHWSCGKDGNMYRIRWNGKPETSEASVVEESYQNKIQASKKSFDLQYLTKEDITKYNLYPYPPIYENYKQNNVLGLEYPGFIDTPYKDSIKTLFQYFNGYYGPKRKLKLFICLFYDNKPIDIAFKQKSYWDGGNKNEVVICIDVDKNTGKINWVYPFSWTSNKRILVDLREDIAETKNLNFNALYTIIEKDTEGFKYKDFREFDYITIDPTTGEIWLIYILTIVATIGSLYYGYVNEYTQD